MTKNIVFEKATDIQRDIYRLVNRLGLDYIKTKNIFCYRSYGSRAQARARIWAFPKLWQKALKIAPHYIIEVISEKFDCLDDEQKTKVLIHELLHIPKTFSGALLPHRTGTFRLDQRKVNQVYREYKTKLKSKIA